MSTLLQTCPYLTAVLPGKSCPIVFAIDESEPFRPPVSAPPDAAFGIIDLSREINWHNDIAALELLEFAAKEPFAQETLIARFGGALVSDVYSRAWLKQADDLCREYLLTTAQIEVNEHCNWGCKFCPVSLYPKPTATMSMPLFSEIIEKLSAHGTLRYVTFHFYNEPTLDRFFVERVSVLQRYRMRLRLFTNASGLTRTKIAALADAGVLDLIAINVPALHASAFEELTQSKTYRQSFTNVNNAIDFGLPVRIVVNGSDGDLARRTDELRRHYEPRGVKVVSSLMSDRAGTLSGDSNQGIRVDGPLRGCGWPVNHAHFSVIGDMFICCNDYFQREVFGNIRDGSIDSIMSSQKAVSTRRQVFGVDQAPDDYLCRSCHDQLPDFPLRQFRPLARFPSCRPQTNRAATND